MKWSKIYPYLLFAFTIILSCGNPTGANKMESPAKDSAENSMSIDATLSDSARLLVIEKLMLENNFDLAITHINHLLKENPVNPAWLFIKADALEKKHDTATALQCYLKADSIAGKFLQARMAILNIYAETLNPLTISYSTNLLQDPASEKIQSDILMMQAIYLTKSGKINQAEAIYSKIIKEDYTFLQAYIEKGLLYYDQQQYQKALDIFELSTEVKNDFAEGYFWMGKTYNKLHQKEAAILHFKKSLALDPSIQEAREELKTLGAIQ